MNCFADGRNCHSRSLRLSLIGFHPIKMHVEDGNYYADYLLFSNCLRIAVILTLNMLTDSEMGTSCI